MECQVYVKGKEIQLVMLLCVGGWRCKVECQVYVKGNTAGNVVVLEGGGVRWSVRFM